MKKTIIALILVIPLIFMFTVFSAGSVASIGVDIPASGIEISNKPEDGVLNLDLVGYKNDFEIVVSVLPVKAKNREYSFRIEKADSVSPLADIRVEDGKLKAGGVGKARITAVSKDGGYTDSFVAIVGSSKAVDFGIALFAAIDVDREHDLVVSDGSLWADVTSGRYSYEISTTPQLADASAEIACSEKDFAIVDPASRTIVFPFEGEADLTLTFKDGAKGEIKKTLHVTVARISTSSGITVNGENNAELVLSDSSDSAECYVEFREPPADPRITGTGMQSVKSYTFTPVKSTKDAATKYLLEILFAEGAKPSLGLDLQIYADEKQEGTPYYLSLTFSAFAFNVVTSKGIQPQDSETGEINRQPVGVSITYHALASVSAKGMTYRWSLASPNSSVTLRTSGGTVSGGSGDAEGNACTVTVSSETGYVLVVTAYQNGKPADLFPKTYSFRSIPNLTTMQFTDKTDLGLAESLAIGEKKYAGGIAVDTDYVFSLKCYDNAAPAQFKSSDVIFASSDDSIAKIVLQNGKPTLKIYKSGEVTLTAEWIYNSDFGTSVSAAITVFAVRDGVQVATSPEFFAAAESGKQIVLTGNIALGTSASGEVLPNATLVSMVKETPTTYNNVFCKKNGITPNIKFVVEFRNDLYGNGYSLDAGAFTTARESGSEKPLIFGGPLPFAAIATAKVASQDNVVFLLRTDGVTLWNAELKGCSDETLENDSGEYDLTKLNMTGTTVDVNASANLLNCRVKNGRTAVRVYGGNRGANSYFVNTASEVDADKERISVRIEGCILSQAREFLLKIGTNKALQGKYSDTVPSGKYKDNAFSPALKDASGKAYPASGIGQLKDDDYFMSRYVLTDVTLKDSVLATSGLFAIGMETNFSGVFLNDATPDSIFSAWYGIGGTSFPAILRLAGDVRIYDWKNLANVDSSTLIETSAGASSFLTLDIRAILQKVESTDPEKYSDLFVFEGEETFVHGGIAFYGGGKNYSQIDLSGMEPALKDLRNFDDINIAVLYDPSNPSSDLSMQGQLLPNAAGLEDFRFYLYDGKSANSLAKQRADFKAGTAYSGIRPVTRSF